MNVWTGKGRQLQRTEVPTDVDYRAVAFFSSGVSQIAYYSSEFDHRVARENPSWLCHRDREQVNDRAYGGLLGQALDITSPYRDIVEQRLRELVRSGIKAIYLDRSFLPEGGDISLWGARDYESRTGRAAPWSDLAALTTAPGNWYASPRYTKALVQWYADRCARVTEVLVQWRDAIRQEAPNAVLIASASTLPAFVRPDSSSAWCEVVDSVKTEAGLANAPSLRNGAQLPDSATTEVYKDAVFLGWTLLRDASRGRPCHVWSGRGLTGAQLMGWVRDVIAHGSIAAVDVTDAAEAGAVGELAELADLGSALGPYLSGLTPAPLVSVYMSQRLRDALLVDGTGVRAVLDDLVTPSRRAYSILSRMGLPVGVVTDEMLAGGPAPLLKVLVAPGSSALTTDQRESLERWRALGVAVLEVGPDGDWDAAGATWVRTLQERTTEVLATSPVRVSGKGARTNLFTAFTSTGHRRLVLTATARGTDASSVTISWKPDHLPGAKATDVTTMRPIPIGASPTMREIQVPVKSGLAVVVLDQSALPSIG